MLKYLKVQNFLSIKEKVEITFDANKYGSKGDNIFHIGKNAFAKSNLIYGANATGKSTLLRAMWIIWHFTLNSALQGPLPVTPFLLNKSSRMDPSLFEIGFFLDDKEYVYNFSLLGEKVVTENLIIIRGGKKVHLFTRQGNEIIQCDRSFESEVEKGKARMVETASFISVLNTWNGQLSGRPIGYFFSKINIILSSETGEIPDSLTLGFLKEDPSIKQLLIDFLQCADFNIDDIKVSEFKLPDEFLNQLKLSLPTHAQIPHNQIRIEIGHKLASGEMQYFDLSSESSGTIRIFKLFGFILKALKNEELLFVDEIETNLHPHILRNLFKLFHSELGTKYQFIFTTHNFDILDLSLFKKEQIKILEKIDGSTKISTLFDFTKLRTEHDLRKMFNQGTFGGIPKNIRDFTPIMKAHFMQNN